MLTAAHQTATGFTLDVTDFPAVVSHAPQKKTETKQPESVDLDAALEAYEREILLRTLKAAKGNKTQAANMLNISRARLHRRIEQWGLEWGACLPGVRQMALVVVTSGLPFYDE